MASVGVIPNPLRAAVAIAPPTVARRLGCVGVASAAVHLCADVCGRAGVVHTARDHRARADPWPSHRRSRGDQRRAWLSVGGAQAARVDVDRAELEAGVVAVHPVLDVADEESTATRAAPEGGVGAYGTLRRRCSRGLGPMRVSGRGRGVIRRAFPTLNGDDEESFSAVAVVAEAAAIGVLAAVRLLGRTHGGVVAARPRRSPPSGLRPLVPNNGRPGPGGGGPRVAGLDAPASCGCPTPPVVDRRIGGVGSIAPLVPNNSRPGPAVPMSVPGQRGARASTRPVPAPASTAIRSDAQVRAETQLGHGVQQDVLLALARSLIADLWLRRIHGPPTLGSAARRTIQRGTSGGNPGRRAFPPRPSPPLAGVTRARSRRSSVGAQSCRRSAQ
jgi:hypothetical protein